MRRKFVLPIVFTLLVMGTLISLTGCAEDVNKDEFARQTWHQTQVSQEEFTLPDDFAKQKEVYLFISRDLIDSNYEVFRATLGDEKIELINSSFNLTSPDSKALFLVGKFEIKGSTNALVLEVPGPIKQNEICIAYKEQK